MKHGSHPTIHKNRYGRPCGTGTWAKHPEHASNGASIETLSEQLANLDEAAALHASYTLGLQGEKAIPAMIDALSDTEDENPPRNAGYGFTNVGEVAVPALLELTKNPDQKSACAQSMYSAT